MLASAAILFRDQRTAGGRESDADAIGRRPDFSTRIPTEPPRQIVKGRTYERKVLGTSGLPALEVDRRFAQAAP